MMKIDVLTLFAAMFAGPLDESIIQRARRAGLLDLQVHDLRRWTHDRHQTVHERRYAGGPGMVMKAAPLLDAIAALQAAAPGSRVIVVTIYDDAKRRSNALAAGAIAFVPKQEPPEHLLTAIRAAVTER